jgi:hypothetical protein
MAIRANDPAYSCRGPFAARRKDPWSWTDCFPPTTRSLSAFRFHFGQSFSAVRVCLPKDTRSRRCTGNDAYPNAWDRSGPPA